MNTVNTTVIQPAMKIHEAAYLFPEMTKDAFLKLKEDIRINGQQIFSKKTSSINNYSK